MTKKRRIILTLGLAAILIVVISFYYFRRTEVMNFEKYDPISTLVVAEHNVTSAKFPFVDVHSHQWDMPKQDLDELAKVMDTLNMKVMVNLSGKSGDYLKDCMTNVRKHHANRFLVFANINWKGFGEDKWTENAVENLKADFKNGASGLKIYEELGTYIKDTSGKKIAVNDQRLDPIWELCGREKKPVLIHTAAPKSFWDKVDNNNERWLELVKFPDRQRHDQKRFSTWRKLINDQHDVFRKHPNTTFIAAHLDWFGNDLDMLGKILDSIPNMYTEIGAVVAELGRQPKNGRAFMMKYQDRVLFGKDSWVPEEYPTYFRVLETDDEYFPYHKKYHAFWSMYGLSLPDSALKKIYFKNALKILPDIDKSLFPN